LRAHVLGQRQRSRLRSVVVERVVVAVAELLADRGHLLTEEELALRLVHPLGDVVADALGHHQLRQRLTRPGEHELQPGVDIDRLEHGELGLDLVVGPRRHGVGQRAGLVHRAQDLGQPPGATLLGDLLEDGAELWVTSRWAGVGPGRRRSRH
jgi:hypothetical protein